MEGEGKTGAREIEDQVKRKRRKMRRRTKKSERVRQGAKTVRNDTQNHASR
jgi:hypothetical protein